MPRRPLTRLQAVLTCAAAAITALMSAVICAIAVLTPAPAVVVPIVALVCVCCPMLAALELPRALAALRRRGEHHEAHALHTLRRSLAQLPETEHPLGL
jgi:hypothetical protein